MFMPGRFGQFEKGEESLENGIWYYKIENCKFYDLDANYNGWS